MIHFNIITTHKLRFLIKMRLCTTSNAKQFTKYEIHPPPPLLPPPPSPPLHKNPIKTSLIIHANDVTTFSKLEKKGMSHKLHLIRKISMVKVVKKRLCWKFAPDVLIYPHYKLTSVFASRRHTSFIFLDWTSPHFNLLVAF